jgi:hypothetical protein
VLAVKPDPMASDVTFAKLITFTVESIMGIKPKPGMMQMK